MSFSNVYSTMISENNFQHLTVVMGSSIHCCLCFEKQKVGQMLLSSFISSRLVSSLEYCTLFHISMNIQLYFRTKMCFFFVLNIKEKDFLNNFIPHDPPTNPYIVKCILIFCIIRGTFGKFLAWSFIPVTDLQTLLCMVSF